MEERNGGLQGTPNLDCRARGKLRPRVGGEGVARHKRKHKPYTHRQPSTSWHGGLRAWTVAGAPEQAGVTLQ